MRRTHLVVIACAVSALVSGCAATRPPTYKLDAKPVPYDGYAATYPSGLRLVAYQMPQADRFMVATSFAAGAAHDPVGQEGLAHVVEHLVYRARPRGAGQPTVAEWLTASGWRWNASTAHDATTFWEIGKPSDLNAALAFEALRLRDPLAGVGDQELAQELAVISNERRQRVSDDAWGSAVAEMLAASFAGTGYGHSAIGNASSLSSVTLASARSWVSSRYVPQRALIVVVSPLSPREVSEIVLREFGELALNGGIRTPPETDAPPALTPRPAPAEPRVVRAPIERPRVWMAWPVPGPFAPSAPHFSVVAGGVEARVRAEVSRNWLNDDVSDIDAGYVDLGGAGLIWAGAELRDEKIAPKMIRALREAMRADRDYFGTVVSRDTIDRILLREYLAMEELDASEIADYVRATGNTDYIADHPRRTLFQLQTSGAAYANRWLVPEQGVTVLALPNENVTGESVVASAGSGRIDPLDDEAGGVRVPGVETVLEVATPPGLHAAERRELANGLKVVVARRGRHGAAEIRLVIRTDVEGGARVPRFAPALAISHSERDRAVWRAERLGATSNVWWGPEHVTFRVAGSSTTLETLLASVATFATRLSFDEPALERTRIALRRRLEWYRDTPTTRAWALMRSSLFGSAHPYGGDESIDALVAVKPSRAADWLRDQVRPQRATLIVVSDEPATPELWRTIEKEFGGWDRGGSDVEPTPAPPLPPARRVVLVDRPGATQALLLVGLRAPAPAARDAVATEAAEWLLESRVNRRLRVEEGLSYGAGVRAIDNGSAGALVLRVNVERGAVVRSLRTILEAASTLARDPVDVGAASRARWRLARSFAFRFDRLAGAAAALEESALREGDDDAWELRPASIAALTPGRIRSAAQALGFGREAIVVVGDAAALTEPLRAAGFDVEKEGARIAR